MAVQLNHTLVHAHDSHSTATWLAELLGLEAPTSFGPFWVVSTANGVSLDFIDAGDFGFIPEHYAFLVSEEEWDAILARVKAQGLTFWADPAKALPMQTNTHDGGRGAYFEDPNGHFLEIITVPYGGWRTPPSGR